MELIRSTTSTENVFGDEEGNTKQQQQHKIQIDEVDVDLYEYSIQFRVIVDGIELYEDETLENEVFDADVTDELYKGKVICGKYVGNKIVQLSNGLFCSLLVVKEMGRLIQSPNVLSKEMKSLSLSHLDL